MVQVEQKDIPIWKEWIGTLEGFVNAQIKPQVTGYLLRQTYTDGSFTEVRVPNFLPPHSSLSRQGIENPFRMSFDKGNEAKYFVRIKVSFDVRVSSVWDLRFGFWI